MRIIVLAAGQDSILDGMIKCLIRHPVDGKTILDHIVESADGMRVTVVVGYKAIEIIERQPGLNYVINNEWAVTNNAYSLGLALDESPSIIMPGDIFINRATIQTLARAGENCALVSSRENRGVTAINAEIAGNAIKAVYSGPLKAASDVELLGIYKVSSPALLAEWKKNCLAHTNKFCGEILPCSMGLPQIAPIYIQQGCRYHEINTVADYIRLIKACDISLP